MVLYEHKSLITSALIQINLIGFITNKIENLAGFGVSSTERFKF